MNKPRTIIHLDLDAFFCSVEENRDASLRGKAFAVGGNPNQRGVVASCSYAARQFGVHSAMPMFQAVRVCPTLLVISPHRSAYAHASRQVMKILSSLTNQVEQLSIDEAFLDISALKETPKTVGKNLQRQIQEELNLPSSLGIASNKLVAKIATDVGKMSAQGNSPPNALTLVPHGQEAEFLAPLPVNMLWGVGAKTKETLHQLEIYTIGDVAKYPVIELSKILGKHGYDLSKRAQGIDNRSIVTERKAKSISNERTFKQDKERKGELLQELRRLAKKVALRLQKKGCRGRTIQIKVRWADFTTLSRQNTLLKATNDYTLIKEQSETLFEQVWKPGQAVRLLGVGVSNLESQVQQLGLWDQKVKKEIKLQETINELQKRFGEEVISFGD